MIYIFISLLLISTLSITFFFYIQIKYIPIQIKSVLYEDENLDIKIPTSLIQSIGDRLAYFLFLIERFLLLLKRKIINIFSKRTKRRHGIDFDLFHLWPSFARWIDSHKLKGMALHSPAFTYPTQEFFLTGSLHLPKRAYVGDTCIITLDLFPEFINGDTPKPKIEIKNDDDGNISIVLGWEKSHRWLHIQLIGVGITIKPLDSEAQDIYQKVCSYSWGCLFERSGFHTIALRCALTSSYDGGSFGQSKTGINHTVKVVQFDHMTSRQIKIFAGVFGIISTILTILIGIQKLLFIN